MTMMSHTVGESEPPLLEQTIPDNLDATVARFGDRDALVDVAQGIRWTYAEFGTEVERLARALLAVGVVKGERVGIWAPNCAQWTVVQYATAKIGAILVNINPSYRTHELEFVLKQAGISHLFLARVVQDQRLRRDVRRGPRQLPGRARLDVFGTDQLGRRCWPGRARWTPSRWPRCRPVSTATTRSTSSTPRAPPASPRARR